jgi:hypothetical protein
MSPGCNNGRFATPKHERRAVGQIALLNNRQSGRITSNPEVIAGSVSENALSSFGRNVGLSATWRRTRLLWFYYPESRLYGHLPKHRAIWAIVGLGWKEGLNDRTSARSFLP